MQLIQHKEEAEQLFKLIKNTIEQFTYLGKRAWGNPAGQALEDTYEVKYGEMSILVASIQWNQAHTDEVNRVGVISTIMRNTPSHQTLGQVLEVNIAFEQSKRFNTRVYVKKGICEIRNYGKFTIGRSGIKRVLFFEYLGQEGYHDEIKLDEEGNQYICILKIDNSTLAKEYFAKQLVKWTYVLDDFKRGLGKEGAKEEIGHREWLIPCNVKYYDAIGAFKKFKIIDWKQSTNIEVGDTVYIYIGKPWKQIKYKCIARAVELKEASRQDSAFILDGSQYIDYGRYMRLELIEEYIEGVFTNEELKGNGVASVQGPRTVPEALRVFIEKTLEEGEYVYSSHFPVIEDDELIKEIQEFQLEMDNITFKGKTEKEVVVKARMGHGALKKYILKQEHSCRVCGLQDERFLIASHIKPWSVSDEQERLDKNNILLLCPHHDAAFDKGYITFNEDGKILISSELTLETRELLNLIECHEVKFNDNNKEYIEWHRENIFRA